MNYPDDSNPEEGLGILRTHGRGGGISDEERGGSTSGITGVVMDGTFKPVRVLDATPILRVTVIQPIGLFLATAVVEQVRRPIQGDEANSVADNQPVVDPPAGQAQLYPMGELIINESGNPQEPQTSGAQQEEVPVAQYILGPHVPPSQA